MKKTILSTTLLLIIATYGFTQWNQDSTIRNSICNASGQQYYPRSCTDGKGGAIITWVDERNIGSGLGAAVYAQNINADGIVQWASNGIPVYAPQNSGSSAVYATIVSDGNSGAIVVMELSVIGGANQIWAQHINAAGTLLWGNGVQVTDAPDSRMRWAEDPQQYGISADGAGGVFVTWQSYQVDYFNYAQHINASGQLLWGTRGTPLPPISHSNGYRCVIASTGNGTAVAGFTDYNGTNYYVQRIAADGTYAWGSGGLQVSAVYANGGSSDGFNIVYDSVTASIFTAFLTSPAAFSTIDVRVQKIDLNGNIRWSAGGINITNLSNGNSSSPDLLADGSGGLFVAAIVNGRATVQHINTTGNNTWGASGIQADQTPAGGQENPVLVSDGSTGIIVTYNTARNFSTDYPIYSQHYTATGTALWQANGLAVIDNYSDINHEVPFTIYSTAGYAITCWHDERTTGGLDGNNIYAARYGSPNSSLPVRFTDFTFQCNTKQRPELKWTTSQEINSNHFAVQSSNDGHNWTALATIPAAGQSSLVNNYSYTINSPSAGLQLYRIVEIDNDGFKQYSAVIKAACGEKNFLVNVYPNPVKTVLTFSAATTVAKDVSVQLFSAVGVLLNTQKYQLQAGNNQLSINVAGYATGIYSLLILDSNGQVLHTVKLVKTN